MKTGGMVETDGVRAYGPIRLHAAGRFQRNRVERRPHEKAVRDVRFSRVWTGRGGWGVAAVSGALGRDGDRSIARQRWNRSLC